MDEPSESSSYVSPVLDIQPFHEWLAKYEQAWNERLDRMDDYLKELQQQGEPQ
jgi:hypothetical protein